MIDFDDFDDGTPLPDTILVRVALVEVGEGAAQEARLRQDDSVVAINHFHLSSDELD